VGGGADLDGFARELERVADRLRTLSQARLAAAVPGAESRAAAARAVAQRLADAAARLAQEPARTLPALSDLAAGDQLAVCGHDLVTAMQAADPAKGPDVLEAISASRADLDDLRRVL
jgi:hypothetical protein